MEQVTVAVIAALGAGAGVAGGIGGAVLIVPLLLLTGLPAPAAATAGLLAVATGTAAAASTQLGQGLANHRLAVTVEAGAGTGVVVGALLLDVLPEPAFRWLLAAALVAAALSGLRGAGLDPPVPAGTRVGAPGERGGSLSGAYLMAGTVVPYRARRVGPGIALSSGIGLLSGVTGTSGGYLKTPLMREVMGVPVKVAAATTTFASGLTAIAGLAVLLPRGSLDLPLAAATVLGALVGGWAGAAVQARLPPRAARRVLVALLLVIVGVLLWPG